MEINWSASRVILATLLAVASLAASPSTSLANYTLFQQGTAVDSVHHRKATKKHVTTSRARVPKDTVPRVKEPPTPAYTVAPLPNSLLPKNRIVVFYGNPLSKKMGVLGEYPQAEMIAKLQQEVHKFQVADPATPVIPGFHLIVSVAQGAPGKNGLYRLRMTDSLITYWCNLAQSKGYLIFLDVQIGKSTVQSELQPLIPYLKRPYVHLALDPEFSMHHASEGYNPGRKVGVMDAVEINYAIGALAKLVKDNKLPPKILVVHRYTQGMVTHYRDIKPVPEVQFVMNMDGFGPPQLKRDSYKAYESMQPVQFDGFKLFYKNDHPMLTREEVVKLKPSPLFITFQ
ncbi:MAG: hypothetical protein ABI026_12040 [Gemmatimonadaceae bacterium]